jgi:hypothetical protein
MLAVTAGGQLSAKRSSETSAIASLPRCASSSNVTSRETLMLRAPTASSAVRSSSTRSSETSCSSLNGAVRTLYVDGTAPIVEAAGAGDEHPVAQRLSPHDCRRIEASPSDHRTTIGLRGHSG